VAADVVFEKHPYIYTYNFSGVLKIALELALEILSSDRVDSYVNVPEARLVGVICPPYISKYAVCLGLPSFCPTPRSQVTEVGNLVCTPCRTKQVGRCGLDVVGCHLYDLSTVRSVYRYVL
jgi:hypothetical protein